MTSQDGVFRVTGRPQFQDYCGDNLGPSQHEDKGLPVVITAVASLPLTVLLSVALSHSTPPLPPAHFVVLVLAYSSSSASFPNHRTASTLVHLLHPVRDTPCSTPHTCTQHCTIMFVFLSSLSDDGPSWAGTCGSAFVKLNYSKSKCNCKLHGITI